MKKIDSLLFKLERICSFSGECAADFDGTASVYLDTIDSVFSNADERFTKNNCPVDEEETKHSHDWL